jgi:hypothetical protein
MARAGISPQRKPLHTGTPSRFAAAYPTAAPATGSTQKNG